MPATDALSSPRTPALVALGASLAALGGALFFEHVMGLAPCVLCIWQRWAYGAAIVPAVVALAFPGRPRVRALLLGLSGVAFLGGAGLAGFHVGVEQGWWTGTSGCGITGGPAASVEDLTAQILAAPVVRCDEVPWSLFGLSIAGYNLLLSLALAGITLAAAARTARSRRPR